MIKSKELLLQQGSICFTILAQHDPKRDQKI
jgi:hypothetical protein